MFCILASGLGLPRFGLKQERRRIRLTIQNTHIEVLPEEDNDLPAVKVAFSLPAGSYATTVLRELINYKDCTQRVVKSNTEE